MSKEFGMHEMMVSLMTASNMSEENQGKSQTELFIENNESLFKMLCEDEAKSNIWYDLYIDFYKDLVESEHFKTYMHFIQQSFNEESKEWLKQNESKVDAFRNWMNQD